MIILDTTIHTQDVPVGTGHFWGRYICTHWTQQKYTPTHITRVRLTVATTRPYTQDVIVFYFLIKSKFAFNDGKYFDSSLGLKHHSRAQSFITFRFLPHNRRWTTGALFSTLWSGWKPAILFTTTNLVRKQHWNLDIETFVIMVL